MNSVGEGALSNERSATPTRPTVPGAPTLELGHRRQRQRHPQLERAHLERRLGDHRLQGLPRHLGGDETPLRQARQRHQLDRHDASRTATTYYYKVTRRQRRRRGLPLERALADPGRTRNGARRAQPRLGDRRHRQRRARVERPGSDGGSAITGYRIYRGTAAAARLLATVGTVTSWTDTRVANGTTYYYQVSAVNPVGEGSRSNERSATTSSSGDTLAPSTPTNMTTLLSGSTQVIIDWTNSSDNVGVTGYQVYRDGVLVGTVPTSYFVDSGLGLSTSHAYQVRAIDAAGNRSAASTTLGATTSGGGTIGTTGMLSGVVFNANGDVISNAMARVGGTTKTSRTNQNGVYIFPLMQPGSYSITATYRARRR